MDSATRKTRLDELKNNNANVAMTGIPLRYAGDTTYVNVYKIPLEYLTYNKYNGRIGTEVQSFEKQKYILDSEKENDRKIIENFLYKSKEDRNKITMDSLRKIGQQRYGIVTSEGIIVDGNRRAMLLNKLFREREQLHLDYSEVEKCRFFLAIILPDYITKRDILQLETMYQMGEDEKLDYNPIEKYLKCKQLKEYFSEHDIAEFMGETESQIKKWLSILDLMEDYLNHYGYEGIYTRLEKREGPFVDLDRFLGAYADSKVRNVDWYYEDSDINDLKIVCFDYIRARYEGKEFRDIADSGTRGSIFVNHDIWESFFKEHSENILLNDEPTVEEIKENRPGEDLSELLRARDTEWESRVKDFLEGNIKKHIRKLEDKRDSDKPYVLLSRAYNALCSIDMEQNSFYDDPNILEKVKDINTIVWEMKKCLDRGKKTSSCQK